jgi:phage shock protein A
MTSILERLDDLIRGNLHRVVDRALENNSMALFDQDVRDMEAAINHVEEAAINMYAAARANERRLARQQRELEMLEQLVDRYALPDASVSLEKKAAAETQLEVQRELVAETAEQIDRQQAQYETLVRNESELRTRAKSLRDLRPRLESLLALTRARRSVERVEMTLDALRGLGGNSEVALVADSIYQRLGEIEARQATLREAEALQEELKAETVVDQLTQRRRRLGLAQEQEEAETRDEVPDVPVDATEPEPEATDAGPECQAVKEPSVPPAPSEKPASEKDSHTDSEPSHESAELPPEPDETSPEAGQG